MDLYKNRNKHEFKKRTRPQEMILNNYLKEIDLKFIRREGEVSSEDSERTRMVFT